MERGWLAGPARLLVAVLMVAAALPSQGQRGNPDTEVVVVRADEARNRAWILRMDALYLEERGAPSPLRRFELPGWMNAIAAHVRPPDLVIEGGGTVIVSSNVVPQLWRVDPGSVSIVQIEVRLAQGASKDFGFTSLELADAGAIRARSAMDGSRWEIDLGAGVARPRP